MSTPLLKYQPRVASLELKRHAKFLLFGCLMCFSVIYILFARDVKTVLVIENIESPDTVLPDNYFLINTEGCVIPNMDPFDASIKKFIFEEDPVVCNNGTPPLVSTNLTSIFLQEDEKIYDIYNITDLRYLKCCYYSFVRIEPKSNSYDNKFKFSQNCTVFSNSTEIIDEYIQVKCFYETNVIYEDFFSFIPTNKSDENESKYNQDNLNVLMIGLDSISRLNLIRQMPKTIQVLEELQAIGFMGYNKVGDNTFPNLIPVLTGLSDAELEKSCWEKKLYFDECPFIWKKFKNLNFTTVFAEDAPWMGLFNYQRKGFLKQPTDYYWGYFDYRATKSIGNNHRMNVDQCIGSFEDYVRLLDYTEKYVETMSTQNKNYFGFFWQSSLSHDFLNKPKLGDENYSNLLKRLKENGYLNKTALVFFSDHGIRWGGIRSTFQGSMEERLPFLYIYLPPWYKTKFPIAFSNLIQNSLRLSTPFDLHDTLEDLLNPFLLTETFLESRSKLNQSTRSQSLFNLIPKTRTCEDAGISSHFCTCQRSKPIDIKSETSKNLVNFAVNSINQKLTNYSECVVLELVEILEARVLLGSESISKKVKNYFSDFTLTFKTSPGDGIFEATVRNKNVNNKNEYEIIGSISRLNLYGTQSFCMEDFHLKLYCFCRQLILAKYS